MNAPNDDPPHLRTLRRLINVMTVVFTLGFITIVIVIVMQFTRTKEVLVASGPEMPPFTSLPGGEIAQAVTYGKSWIAIVTIDGNGFERIRTYGLDGMPRQTFDIEHTE